MKVGATRTAAEQKQLTTSFGAGRPSLLQRKCACGGAAGLTGKCETCESKNRFGAGLLQARLMVGAADDRYEREAERIAGEVMRSSEPGGDRAPLSITPLMQRRAEPGDVGGSGASVDGAGMAAPPVVHDVLASPGQPLDTETRAFFEPRLGHDFSHVRVHADAKAAESARAVGADAYTVGRDIVFGAGWYAAKTSLGASLLAHELVHAVQQHGRIQQAQSG